MERRDLNARGAWEWQDGDRWVVVVTIARPDGLLVRRYVESMVGPYVTLTSRQARAKKHKDRYDAEQLTCDVRMCRRDLHPVRMVRLTRVLEERPESLPLEAGASPRA